MSGASNSVNGLFKAYASYCIWGLFGLGLGFGIAFIVYGSAFHLLKKQSHDSFKTDDHISKELFRGVDLKSLKKYRDWISSNEAEETRIVNWILSSFKDLDTCFTSEYGVLLSIDDSLSPSKVEGIDGGGNVVFSSDRNSIRQNKYPRIAFSTRKSVESNSLIYANYGRREDFDYLRSHGIGVSEKILIVRFGKISIGQKIVNAQGFDAKALIFIDDGPMNPKERYVNYGPGLLTQNDGIGDPLSPGWPSLEGSVKLNTEQLSVIPRIPVYSVDGEISRNIMSNLGGRDAPNDWVGGMNGVRYKVGGEFLPSEELQRVRLQIHSNNEVKKIRNIIGIIRGSVEPDRYIVIGSHRMTTSKGSSSGVSAIVKLARSFAETMKKKKWRPRRSIIFISWAAHEFGYVGSTEWIEENLPLLKNRLVAYINLDECYLGSLLTPTASPGLSNVLFKSAKRIKDPDDPTKNYYESKMQNWNPGQKNLPNRHTGYPEVDNFFKNDYGRERDHFEERESKEDDGFFDDYTDDDSDSGASVFSSLGSNGDHYPFTFISNTPSIDIRFGDPLRDSEEETDPRGQLRNLQLCIRYASDVIRSLADSLLLPLNPQEYSRILREGINHLESNQSYTRLFSSKGLSLKYLDRTALEFESLARNWTNYIEARELDSNPLLARMVNDQLLHLPRVFSSYDPDRNASRNILYGSDDNPVLPVPLPVLRAEIRRLLVLSTQSIGDLDDEDRSKVDINAFRTNKHITDLLVSTKAAVKQLRDFIYIH